MQLASLTKMAGGITGVARTAGAAISPIFAGYLFSRPALIDIPFFIAGTLKIAYHLVLYREFAAIRPPEEADQWLDMIIRGSHFRTRR